MAEEMDSSDLLSLHQLVALYSHIVDRGEWEALGDVFTDDAVFDLSSGGLERIEGLGELRSFFEGLQHPLAHHTTNLVVEEREAGAVALRSKALVLFDGGRVGSAEYHDDAVRTPRGWRLKTRTVLRVRP